MRFYQLDPTKDARWAEFAGLHPKASIFHSVAWLMALQRTYGYEPVAFTTSPPTAELKNGLAFCHVKSWLTGHRLVSLPFSDHCELLFESAEDVSFLMHCLKAALEREDWKYLEIRPVSMILDQSDDGLGLKPTASYFMHRLDLRPDLDELFKNLDKDSVQRRIHRARRAGLVEKCGRSDDLVRAFYRLLVATRSRHRIPPPPYDWFRNLVHYLGDALEIRLAYERETPIAGVLTLRFRDVAYYKYGCSEQRFNNLGAMPWLLWNAIVAAKSNGANEFDMGRTDEYNSGLLAFKNHWVPRPTRLLYWRFPDTSRSFDSAAGWKLNMAKHVFSRMPNGLLTTTGKLLYRHIG